jgi:hypothetical protein
MGAIDPQLAQLVEEDLDADATKQIPSLSQAVPPQPQHPVRDLVVYDCVYKFANTDVLPARHARSVPIPTAARANVPGIRASHGLRRTGPARAASKDSNRLPILSQEKGALDTNKQEHVMQCDSTVRHGRDARVACRVL